MHASEFKLNCQKVHYRMSITVTLSPWPLIAKYLHVNSYRELDGCQLITREDTLTAGVKICIFIDKQHQ